MKIPKNILIRHLACAVAASLFTFVSILAAYQKGAEKHIELTDQDILKILDIYRSSDPQKSGPAFHRSLRAPLTNQSLVEQIAKALNEIISQPDEQLSRLWAEYDNKMEQILIQIQTSRAVALERYNSIEKLTQRFSQESGRKINRVVITNQQTGQVAASYKDALIVFEAFFTLSPMVQAAIVAHEIGHNSQDCFLNFLLSVDFFELNGKPLSEELKDAIKLREELAADRRAEAILQTAGDNPDNLSIALQELKRAGFSVPEPRIAAAQAPTVRK